MTYSRTHGTTSNGKSRMRPVWRPPSVNQSLTHCPLLSPLLHTDHCPVNWQNDRVNARTSWLKHNYEQVVEVIWCKAASPPHMDSLAIFTRWCQCALPWGRLAALGATWQIWLNWPSLGGDAALCQFTLITCLFLCLSRFWMVKFVLMVMRLNHLNV